MRNCVTYCNVAAIENTLSHCYAKKCFKISCVIGLLAVGMFAKVPPTRHHQSVAQPSRDSRNPQLSTVRERGTEVLITIAQTKEMATAKEEATGLNASEVVSQHG